MSMYVWDNGGQRALVIPGGRGGGEYPIWSHTIVKTQQRLNPPQERKPPHYFTQPDQYEVRHKDTMMARAASAIAFPKQNHVQDLKKYVKSQTVNRAFNRDFTRSGSCLAF
eukprot:g2037.t1